MGHDARFVVAPSDMSSARLRAGFGNGSRLLRQVRGLAVTLTDAGRRWIGGVSMPADWIRDGARAPTRPLPVVEPPLVRDRYELARRSWAARPARPRDEAAAEFRTLVERIREVGS